MSVTAYLGLGSNLGDRAAALAAAVAALRGSAGVRVGRLSALYETAPVGGPAGQGPYLNAAAVVESYLSAADLRTLLLRVEADLGRVRLVADGPRTLDLDLLLFVDQVHRGPDLVLPHPRLHER